jgi:arginyl-tRNA synthetase
VGRVKLALEVLGIDPSRLHVLLVQLVSVKRGEEAVRMSRRAGVGITLKEMLDEVGPDPVRYFFLLRSADAHMQFDVDLAKQQSSENPVYYAQYAHARLANVEATAAERHPSLPSEADVSLLVEPWELEVVRQVAAWPDAVEEAALLLEPHRIPYYVQELAVRVHAFYDRGNAEGRHRVVVEDPALTRARLELCRAARATLRTALGLIGVSAPERM